MVTFEHMNKKICKIWLTGQKTLTAKEDIAGTTQSIEHAYGTL